MNADVTGAWLPAPDTSAKPVTPIGSVGVGVIAPYDFALDRELWRWVPDSVNLLLTRTPHQQLPVSVSQAEVVSAATVLHTCTRTITETAPDVVAYACTSGSFVRGSTGEVALRQAIESAGVPRAVTTSGALVDALTALQVRRLAVATPYDDLVTGRLRAFLAAAGIEVVSCSFLGLTERIWALNYEQVSHMVRGCVVPGAEAVFVSCTNVPTFDILGSLEAELGLPVLSSNQVTLWAALAAVGLELSTPTQALASAPRPPRVLRPPGVMA
ncbi:maleate cis-trans isomerase family protein [Ornithinimicrobium sediminis]|uniref:maleate cis-trans isomerase family protein n=1 Tax=Ornithinimicrobium sediminis TaxID=2904603 RepID=UPI001E5A1265|nr:aspartate/glutamate racemase family protein [Ornithinimicrobium sediminis]MCE0486582.1 aspartate/glutamate racemase family protein [Ornithinimicrobium sediminis]